jgi:hypothetical protein
MIDKIIKLATGYPIMALSTLMPLFVILFALLIQIKLDKQLKLVLGFAFFFFITDIPLWITTGLGINNLKYHYIREFLNHLIMIGIYYFILSSPGKKRVILIIETFLLLIGAASIFFYKENTAQLTSIYKLGIIFVVFMHFHSIMSELKIKNLLNYPFFWISSGLLIFSCGSILILLFFNYTFISKEGSLFKIYSQFLDVLIILMFIFIGIGFLNAKESIHKQNHLL